MTDLYPSRCYDKPRLLPRQDPVAWQAWNREAPLSHEQYDDWCRDGFLQLQDVFDAREVTLLQHELEHLLTRASLRQHPAAVTETGQRKLRSLFAPQQHSLMLDALMRDRRILEIARFLLNSPVYVHQSRINFKPGLHGGEFFWHSDFETWHTEDGMPRMRALSVSISLTDNNAHNGPLLLIPGSHQQFISCVGETPDNYYQRSLKKQTIGTPDADSIAQLAAQGIKAATGKAGTITLFDCNVLHGSAGNLSPWPRSNVFFVYNSVYNTPQMPFAGTRPRPAHLAERKDFSALTPITPDYAALATEQVARAS